MASNQATVNPDELAQKALQILQGGEADPREARKLLLEAVKAAPDRPDLLHALGMVQLQLGEPEIALRLVQEAIERLREQALRPDRREQAQTLIEGFLLTQAAAFEDLQDWQNARASYMEILKDDAEMPRAQSGLAQLLLGVGDLDAATRMLEAYIEADRDEDPFIEGASALLDSVKAFLRDDIHPREFLNAHRGSYVQMFNSYADEQQKLGWIAEAAKMKRAPDGRVVMSVPEGARPYAGVRVDLVDPQTGQIGQVGDQPMVVALAAYQPLAQSVIQFPWRDQAFDVRVSSQCPWDQLPVQILLQSGGKEAVNELDKLIGDWYLAGFEGAYGTPEGNRFHYISDPSVRPDWKAVVYDIDMGRASTEAIDDLLRRLTVFHSRFPIARLLLGRGYLP